MLPRRQNPRKPLSENFCPVALCMSFLGGAWTPQLIWQLSHGARRFNELKHYLAPISSKMLSARLKELEEKRIVSRTILDTSPPSTEYALTEFGHELLPALIEIAKIGLKIHEEIDA